MAAEDLPFNSEGHLHITEAPLFSLLSQLWLQRNLAWLNSPKISWIMQDLPQTHGSVKYELHPYLKVQKGSDKKSLFARVCLHFKTDMVIKKKCNKRKELQINI